MKGAAVHTATCELDKQIKNTQLLIDQLDHPTIEQDAELFLTALQGYVTLLRAERYSIEPNENSVWLWSQSAQDASKLLLNLANEEPEAMEDWYFGCTPRNDEQRFANHLVRITHELTTAVFKFKYGQNSFVGGVPGSERSEA
jgi:hypothetical protein